MNNNDLKRLSEGLKTIIGYKPSKLPKAPDNPPPASELRRKWKMVSRDDERQPK